MKLILLVILTTLFSCSTVKDVFEPVSNMDDVQESHKPLEKQRLVPRPGFEGHLTNRVCLKWYGAKCEQISVRKYNIKDPIVRKRLIALNFACRVSGRRYRVCPDKPGLCRRDKHRSCKKWGRGFFGGGKKRCKKWGESITEKFIPIDEYGLLLDAATECKKGY